jgi:N-acetylneuraminate synthase
MQNKTKFIAEIGSNHNQDLNRAFRLIETAKKIGCWAVKFQYYEADKMWSSDMVTERKSAKAGEIPLFWFPQIKERCKQLDIEFGCSIYHPENLRHIVKKAFKPDFIKISSFDIFDLKLIKYCMCDFAKIFISTGHASLIDLKNINQVIENSNIKNPQPVYLLHCVSNYPTKPKDANLYKINEYRQSIDDTWLYSAGYSDHTAHPAVIYQAALGCESKYIEFHLDLEDGQGNEFRHGHCWKPANIKEVIDNIAIAKKSYRNIHPYVKNPESQLRGDWE